MWQLPNLVYANAEKWKKKRFNDPIHKFGTVLKWRISCVIPHINWCVCELIRNYSITGFDANEYCNSAEVWLLHRWTTANGKIRAFRIWSDECREISAGTMHAHATTTQVQYSNRFSNRKCSWLERRHSRSLRLCYSSPVHLLFLNAHIQFLLSIFVAGNKSYWSVTELKKRHNKVVNVTFKKY